MGDDAEPGTETDVEDALQEPLIAEESGAPKKLLGEYSTLPERLDTIIKLAAPMSISWLLRAGENLIQLYFAGMLSRRNNDSSILAGMALANMFFNVSFLSPIVGMSSALDTLCSQNNGAERYFHVSLAVHRSLIVFAAMLVPIAAIWMFLGEIFGLLGVDADTRDVMLTYFHVLAFSVPARMVGVTYRKFLMCVGVTWPHMIAAGVVDLLLLVFCLVFVLPQCGLELGVSGIAWASVAATTGGLLFIITISYRLPQVQQCVSVLPLLPLHRDAWAITCIKEYLSLGFPGMVMVCSEWWAYEIMTIFASVLGPDAVTAQALIFQLVNFAHMIPANISVATNVLVGNAVGASLRLLAVDVGLLCLYISMASEVLLIMPGIYFGGMAFIRVYSSVPEVLDDSRGAIPILALAAFAHGIQSIAGGILRGTGHQKVGAYANLFCFYVIGLPLSWVFCFTMKMRVSGLVLGVSCATVVQCCILWGFVILRGDSLYTKLESLDDYGLVPDGDEDGEGLGGADPDEHCTEDLKLVSTVAATS